MPKFYAVARGRKIGIFNTWPETSQLVHGYPGAKYQGFKSRIEAKNALDDAGIPESLYNSTPIVDPPRSMSTDNSVGVHTSSTSSLSRSSFSDTELSFNLYSSTDLDETVICKQSDFLFSVETDLPFCDQILSSTIKSDTDLTRSRIHENSIDVDSSDSKFFSFSDICDSTSNTNAKCVLSPFSGFKHDDPEITFPLHFSTPFKPKLETISDQSQNDFAQLDTDHGHNSSKQTLINSITFTQLNNQTKYATNSIDPFTSHKPCVHDAKQGIEHPCKCVPPNSQTVSFQPDFKSVLSSLQSDIHSIHSDIQEKAIKIDNLSHKLQDIQSYNDFLVDLVKQNSSQLDDISKLLSFQTKQFEELQKKQAMILTKLDESKFQVTDEAPVTKSSFTEETLVCPGVNQSTPSHTSIPVSPSPVGNVDEFSTNSKDSDCYVSNTLEEDTDIINHHSYSKLTSHKSRSDFTYPTYTFQVSDSCSNILIGDSNMQHIKRKVLDKSGSTEIRTFRGASISRITTLVDSTDFDFPCVRKVAFCAGTVDCNSSYIDAQRIVNDTMTLLETAKDIFPNAMISFLSIPPQSNHKINKDIIQINNLIKKSLRGSQFHYLSCESLWLYVDRDGFVDRGLIRGNVHFTPRALDSFLSTVSSFFYSRRPTSKSSNLGDTKSKIVKEQIVSKIPSIQFQSSKNNHVESHPSSGHQKDALSDLMSPSVHDLDSDIPNTHGQDTTTYVKEFVSPDALLSSDNDHDIQVSVFQRPPVSDQHFVTSTADSDHIAYIQGQNLFHLHNPNDNTSLPSQVQTVSSHGIPSSSCRTSSTNDSHYLPMNISCPQTSYSQTQSLFSTVHPTPGQNISALQSHSSNFQGYPFCSQSISFPSTGQHSTTTNGINAHNQFLNHLPLLSNGPSVPHFTGTGLTNPNPQNIPNYFPCYPYFAGLNTPYLSSAIFQNTHFPPNTTNNFSDFHTRTPNGISYITPENNYAMPIVHDALQN